jgi:GTPase SAR1 family protein
VRNKRKTAPTPRGSVPLNRAVLDVIVPQENFDFAPERAVLDGRKKTDPLIFKSGRYFRQILTCSSFQSLYDVGWGTTLYNNPHVVTSLFCEPYEKSRAKHDIDNDASRNRLSLDQGGTESKQVERMQSLDHTHTMLTLMGDDDERFFKTTIYQQVFAEDEAQLTRQVNDVRDALDSNESIRTSTASHNQRQAFLGASPLLIADKTTIDQNAKPMPASTIGASLVFSKSGIDDGRGVFIGTDEQEGLIRLEMSSQRSSRTNMNAVVLGTAGMGKSTLMQKIILDDIAKGTRVIVIDPEREYRTLCTNVHGQWINLGGSSHFRISPLRPRVIGALADTATDSTQIYQATQNGEVLSETVSVLRTFFSIAFGATRREIDYLEKVLKEEYERFGITNNTPLRDVDMNRHPVMSDILAAVQRKVASAKGKAKGDLEDLCGKLWPGVEGSFSNLWNGYSNVSATSDFIVLDTHDLNSRDEAIASAQYFNLLTWVWDQIVQARITGRKIRVVIDECHLVLNKDMESAAQFVSMIAKRIRKYNGGLMCATQQVADLNEKHGYALLNQACYKFLLSTDAINLLEEQRIFNLTDDVALRLEQGQRGQGVIIAGREKVWANIQITDTERRYLTHMPAKVA